MAEVGRILLAQQYPREQAQRVYRQRLRLLRMLQRRWEHILMGTPPLRTQLADLSVEVQVQVRGQVKIRTPSGCHTHLPTGTIAHHNQLFAYWRHSFGGRMEESYVEISGTISAYSLIRTLTLPALKLCFES